MELQWSTHAAGLSGVGGAVGGGGALQPWASASSDFVGKSWERSGRIPSSPRNSESHLPGILGRPAEDCEECFPDQGRDRAGLGRTAKGGSQTRVPQRAAQGRHSPEIAEEIAPLIHPENRYPAVE